MRKSGPPANESDRWIETRWGTVRARILGQPGRTAVLTIPDPPNTLEHQQNLLLDLARDHRVIAFESPGFGYSTAKRGYGFTFDHNADVILDVLNALSATGATLALTCVSVFPGLVAARRRPDVISHLVLAQAGDLSQQQQWARRVDFHGILGTPLLGQLFMALAKRWVARHWYQVAVAPGSDARPPFAIARESFQRGCAFPLASAFQALHREALDRDLSAAQKTVVLWGLADRTHRKTNRESIRRYLPNSSYVELRDCGHCPDLEMTSDYASFIRAVRRPDFRLDRS